MHEQMTVLRPAAHSPEGHGISAFPPEVLEMLLHHAQTPPTAPSTRTELPIPEVLDRIVLSCLAKDPAARPQSARELSLRLAAVDGAGAWTDERTRDWWMTHQPTRA
jgi:serine/threonine protein kinase